MFNVFFHIFSIIYDGTYNVLMILNFLKVYQDITLFNDLELLSL